VAFIGAETFVSQPRSGQSTLDGFEIMAENQYPMEKMNGIGLFQLKRVKHR